MSFGDLFREAIDAIRAHALRSFLTLLGIIIGVTTIVGVVSVIAGLDGFVKEKIIVLSPDVYVLTKFGIIRGREEFLEALKRKDIDWNEYQRMSQLLRESTTVGAQLVGTTAVKHREKRLSNITVIGVTANMPQLFDPDLDHGRFFIDAEDHVAAPVAIIGWDIKEELYPQSDPIGRTVNVGGLAYNVIGVIKKKGSLLGENQDNRIWVPISTFQKNFAGRRESLDLVIRARGGVDGVERSVDEARAVLRALRHSSFKDPDPFGVVTAEALQTLWRQISAAAFIFMTLISSVSLGIGGIVITNIMLVSVLERTQEIGVRKAVGAHEADIRRQFVLEATLLSLVGGLIGSVLGGGLALIVDALGFPAKFSPAILAAGLVLSAVVGVLAGWWPAYNASRLNAIEALRAE